MARRLVAILFLLALAPAARAEELPLWRHAIIEAKSDAGFYEMVAQGGFAQKRGLRIEILEFKNDSLGLRAVLSGDIDSFEGNPGGAMIAASRGADIRIIGCSWPITPLGMIVGRGIATVQDLKGKTIAISTAGGSPDLLARTLLERNHIALSEVRFANMGADADRYRAVVAGLVDATVVSAEFAVLGAADGVRLLAAGADIAPNFVRTCEEVSGQRLAARRADAVRFLAAEMDALRYAVSHRDAELELTRQVIQAKQDDPRPGYIFDYAVAKGAIDPDLAIPRDKLEWTQDLLNRTGNMTGHADLAKIIADDIHADALALAGK